VLSCRFASQAVSAGGTLSTGHDGVPGDTLLNAILATAPDAMVMIDESGIILHFSVVAEQLFGYAPSDVIGRNVNCLMPTPHRESHDRYLQTYLETGIKRIINTGRIVEAERRDGSLFPMQLHIGEAVIDGRHVFTGFIHDMSERFAHEARVQELQAELAHASRLSAVGTLASALAHELNQPLTAIANYMSAARDLLSQTGAADLELLHEACAEAAEQSLRAGQIVRRLREFIAKKELAREPVSLARIISEATTLGLIGAREKGISWSIDAGRAGEVMADRVQLQQVMVNLMRNATEAMENASVKLLTIKADRLAGGMVEVNVADTGSGLDPDVLAHLFQPFVTTKPSGMGLGLSICKTIVEAHDGELKAFPNPGGGTIFRFTLAGVSKDSADAQ
jgi:two-component system, LuxR family, sensor kinase FixL